LDTVVISTLQKLMKHNTIVSIYPDINNSECFSVGFIEAMSNDHIIIKSISKNGQYDGYIIRKIENIFRVDFDGDYEKRLKILYEIQKQEHHKLIQKKARKDTNLFREALKSSMSNKYVVSIELIFTDEEEGEGLFGWVKNISETEVLISKLSYYGHDDGCSIIRFDNIAAINCDTDDEIALRLLNTQKFLEK